MTKWEYVILKCNSDLEVFAVNGKEIVAEIEIPDNRFLARKKRCPYLYEYLPEQGRQGWEVCGTSPYYTGLDGQIYFVQIILKRPLE
ncbi:MAG: hypothetical protein HKUEN02_20780 [Anaerolineaceae bacterium]|nr:MAG: hypothetical protein HKUEN02_20780 [Anaerolineaceae bacterium]